MDPADLEPRPAPVRQAVTQQGIMLGQHAANIQALIATNQTLTQQVSTLSAQVTSLAAQQAPAAQIVQQEQPGPGNDQQRDLPAVPSEPFSGVSSKCKGFIFQCELFFNLKPVSYCTDISKIHFMLGLLRGKALTWAEARFAGRTLEGLTFSAFLQEFRRVFAAPTVPFCASSRLLTITQGRRSVEEYALEFRTLAAEVDWTDSSLCAAFYQGLSEYIKDELAYREEPAGLEALITLTGNIDSRLQARQRERCTVPAVPRLSRPSLGSSPTPTGLAPDSQSVHVPEEPMQVGRARLSSEERNRRLRAGECLYCGKAGHFLSVCPLRPKDQARQ